MGSIISQACTSRLEYADHLKVRNVYSLPKVAASRAPQLDSYLKTEIPPATKAVDKELATIQSHVLEALTPLSAILETKQDLPKETASAATDAVKLLGNSIARISHLQRTTVISQMNKALLPLVEEDSNFREASPSLFEPEFAQKSNGSSEGYEVHPWHVQAVFFDQDPQQSGGLLSQANTRRGRSPERTAKPRKILPEEHLVQVIHARTFTKSVIMNW